MCITCDDATIQIQTTHGGTKKSRIGSLSEMKMEILWWMNPIRTGGRIKKNPDRHGIRIPVLDENGVQKVGTRNRKQWKRVLTDATGVEQSEKL